MKKNKKLKTIILIIVCAIVGIAFITYFVINNDEESNLSTDSDNVKCIDIETPYTTLEFPKEMEKEVIIKKTEENDYKVQFYGVINDKEELLMDIGFGTKDGTVVGYYSSESERIPITVKYYEPENIDSLDNDAIIHIQEIHTASEYVIYKLGENDKFIPVE